MRAYVEDNTLYIIPESDLVASKVEELRDGILTELKKEDPAKHVIFNVKSIDIVDSLGVNLIIGVYRQCESVSRSFEIINANEKFIKISNFFKFQDYFKVSPEKKAK